MPSVSSVECKNLEHVFADEQGDASIGFRSKDGVVYVYNEHARTQALKSGYPFPPLALLLRLYTSRNPPLGGNRLGMVP
jgi:hypothetical protein